MAEDFEFRDKQLSDTDLEIEARLRPQVFSDFDGQKKIVKNLRVFVEAARLRGHEFLLQHRCTCKIQCWGQGDVNIFNRRPGI